MKQGTANLAEDYCFIHKALRPVGKARRQIAVVPPSNSRPGLGNRLTYENKNWHMYVTFLTSSPTVQNLKEIWGGRWKIWSPLTWNMSRRRCLHLGWICYIFSHPYFLLRLYFYQVCVCYACFRLNPCRNAAGIHIDWHFQLEKMRRVFFVLTIV